jgi:hypothetical protein
MLYIMTLLDQRRLLLVFLVGSGKVVKRNEQNLATLLTRGFCCGKVVIRGEAKIEVSFLFRGLLPSAFFLSG